MEHAGARIRSGRARRSGVAPRVELLEGRIVPSTILVTNANDSGPGSLHEAITQADVDTTPDTIAFAPTVRGTITLLTALPALTRDITLSGPGALALNLARNSDPRTPDFRLFAVDQGARVTITGLTISGGRVTGSSGGGITNGGTLTVDDCTIRGNAALTSSGGGIFNSGTLTVNDSTLSGNSAVGGAFSDRGGGGTGGGIFNMGKLTVTNSTFSGNSAVGGRASLSNGSGSGGGIANTGITTVANSTFSGNSAVGPSGNLGGFGSGGGIANQGTMTVTNSTFSGNSAVGGSSVSLESGGEGAGGGIFNFNERMLTVIDSTFSGNSAVSDNIEGVGGRPGLGGGIGNVGSLTTTASLYENRVGGNIVSTGTSSTFVSQGHNLFSDAPALLLAPTDLTETDPRLGPLADNGGPTQTQALLSGSPAIDAGVAVPGVKTDQRGVPRPQGKAPDIGAFELLIVSIRTSTTTGTNPVGQPDTVTTTLTDRNGVPMVGDRVTFQVRTGPNAGAASAIRPASGLTDAHGQVTFTYVGKLAGTDTIVATATIPGLATPVSSATRVTWGFPPTVQRLQRFGVHAEPTVLVLSFSEPLDPSRAQNLANYRIVALGGPGRGGSRPGHSLRVKAAVYDPSSRTLAIYPAEQLDVHNDFQLTVVGTPPGGVASASGVLLDGAGNGRSGSNFVRTIDRSTLAGSSATFFRLIRGRWATRGGLSQGGA